MSAGDEHEVHDSFGNHITTIRVPDLVLPEGGRLVWETTPILQPDVATSVVIWATHRFVGWHRWPDAPPSRDYLGHSHRHLFHVRVEINVGHDDREIEFHDLGDVVSHHCSSYEKAGGKSCEMMARELRDAVLARWPGRMVTAEISEDGEFGARVLPSA